MTSVQLRQERARVVEQMRELVDRAETENRGLEATEQESYDRAEADFESLTARIERLEAQEARELETAAPIPEQGAPAAGGRADGSDSYRRSDLPDDADGRERRMAFLDLVRHGRAGLSPEARALVLDEDGEILVPEALETELVRAVPALAIMRNIAGVRPIGTNRVRRRSLDEVTVGWGRLETGGQTLTNSMPDEPGEEYTYVEDLYGLAKIGEAELDDSDVNLEAFVVDSFAQAIAEAEDTGFTVGTGHTLQIAARVLVNPQRLNSFSAGGGGDTAGFGGGGAGVQVLELYQSEVAMVRRALQ